MSEHKDAGGIGINWLMFGSNGHEKKPEGGVLENFTRCAEKDFKANLLIKTICDPAKVLSLGNAHFAFYRKGFHNLNEVGNILEGSWSKEVHFEYIRINHYWGKSKEEYIIKMNERGDANAGILTMQRFYDCDRNEVEDTEILSRI